jgi:hypothetical protein
MAKLNRLQKVLGIGMALLGVLMVALTVGNPVNKVIADTTCSDSHGWTKIDSNDISGYPVDGATDYCFKAGSDRSKGCDGGIFTFWPLPDGACGLSHWAYFIPSGSPSPSPTPTNEPSPTETPKPTPTDQPNGDSTPTPTPTDKPGGGTNPTPTEQPTPSPTDEPASGVTPTLTTTPESNDDSEDQPAIGGSVLGLSTEDGEVTGLTTYANTGTATELMIVLESAFGILLTGVGAVGYNRVDGKKKQ